MPEPGGSVRHRQVRRRAGAARQPRRCSASTTSIFRPHNVYGPRQNIGDRYRNVVGIFMNQILQGQPMTIFGDGTQTRAFSYIDDVAPVIAEAIDSRGGLERGVQHRRGPAVHAERARRSVATAMGVPPRSCICRRATRSRTRTRRHDKIGGCSAIAARRRSTTGSREMAAWVARSMARAAAPPFEGIEITRNLPDAWRAMTAVARDALPRRAPAGGSGAGGRLAGRRRSPARSGSRADARVLEIGAGYCCWINAVRAARRVAVDTWPEIARRTRRPACEAMVLDVVQRSCDRSARGSFDVVLASNVLEHFEPDAAAGLVDEVAACSVPADGCS